MTEFTEIPVLDASPLSRGVPEEMAEGFAKAYGETGFAYIVNHGVPEALVERVFAASAAFHSLPRDQKMAVALDANHRGFIPINTSTDVNSKLADVKRPNQSESFMMMREDGPDAPDVQAGAYLAGPNQWPDLVGFREDVMAYHDALTDLGRRLMEVAALSVGANPAELAPAFERPTTWLRLLYYPPTDPAEVDLYGSAPHTDFGCLDHPGAGRCWRVAGADARGGMDRRAKDQGRVRRECWRHAAPLVERQAVVDAASGDQRFWQIALFLPVLF